LYGTDYGNDNQQNDRNPEQNLRTFHRGSRDAAEAEQRCDQRDYQKCNRPVQ
jgi:hypothetical protein